MVKHLPTMRETWVQSLGWEDTLEKEMAIHSSTIAWKIPWTEELVGYSPWGRKESDRTEWLSLTHPGKGKFERALSAQENPLELWCWGSGWYPEITFLGSAIRISYIVLSCVRFFAIPWTVAHQAHLPMGFSSQEYWSGLPFPSPISTLKLFKINFRFYEFYLIDYWSWVFPPFLFSSFWVHSKSWLWYSVASLTKRYLKLCLWSKLLIINSLLYL